MSVTRDGDYVSVAEAATLLKVDRSTVRRWIDRGRLPAYRVGQRYIRLKRSDLERAFSRITPPVNRLTTGQELPGVPVPLTPAEKAEALAVAKRARQLRRELRDRWGASHRDLLADELIDLAREERSWQLS
jgi:excisionase family DNA binding protein